LSEPADEDRQSIARGSEDIARGNRIEKVDELCKKFGGRKKIGERRRDGIRVAGNGISMKIRAVKRAGSWRGKGIRSSHESRGEIYSS
jgi:hypothetical protein